MLGQGVGETIAIIQGRSMTGAFAMPPAGIEGDVGDTRRDLHDDHATLEQEGIQRRDCVVTGSSKQNDPSLEQAGGADVGGSRHFDQLIETAAFRFVVQNGDERRGIDYHQTGRLRSS